MSKGKRGLSLNKPCPKCGSEVPGSYISPLGQGYCGKCTDEIIKQRARLEKGPNTSQTTRLSTVVPGGGSTVIGFAIGVGLGVLGSLAMAVFASNLWGNIVGGLAEALGR